MKIQIKDLEFCYGDKMILTGTNLEIAGGELVSIVGPNGTGKSTLVKCMNGLLKAQRGEIKIDNADVKKITRKQIAKKVSYVPQASTSLFNLNVFDMVLFGRRPHTTWRSSREDRVKALKALKILNIEDLALNNFNELSGGQQQKVIIARALAQETEIIILDEPISNLDIRHQMEVMDTIRELVDKAGISAVMVAHDLNIATRYSDRIVIMNKGEIIAVGKPEKVLTKESIADVYGVEADLFRIDNKPYIIPTSVKHA